MDNQGSQVKFTFTQFQGAFPMTSRNNRGIIKMESNGQFGLSSVMTLHLESTRLPISASGLMSAFASRRPITLEHGEERRPMLIDSVEREDGSGFSYNLKGCAKTDSTIRYVVHVRTNDVNYVGREFVDSREPFLSYLDNHAG
jgi:hypothetical protein